jgi:hypothetical protein
MRLLTSLITLAALAFGAYWAWNNRPEVRRFVEHHIQLEDFRTLEARYTATQITEKHRAVLLPTSSHKIRQPQLLYYPYLLMEVKYIGVGGRTQEGVILWGLEDGEMILNTSTWEKTHGFEDCITAKADVHDFKILLLLSQQPRGLTRLQIAESLHVGADLAESWLSRAQRKHLVVHQDDRYLLHFEKPHIALQPETRLEQQLVTKPLKQAVRIPKRYSLAQIRKLTAAAFGEDFAIRNTQEVFLPVYCVEVQNPDGSVATTYWNALTGQQIESVW